MSGAAGSSRKRRHHGPNFRRNGKGWLVPSLSAERAAMVADLMAAGVALIEVARRVGVAQGTLHDWLRRCRAGDEPYRGMLTAELERRGIEWPRARSPDDVVGGRVYLRRRQWEALAGFENPDRALRAAGAGRKTTREDCLRTAFRAVVVHGPGGRLRGVEAVPRASDARFGGVRPPADGPACGPPVPW